MYQKAKYLPAGDKGVVIEFGNTISKDINKKIRKMVFAIEEASLSGILELVPTYRSLMVYYDPVKWKYSDLVMELEKVENSLTNIEIIKPKVYHIPVAYGGKFGSDLSFVCQHAKLSIEEVITMHTSTDYLIYMLGFTPGFTYLGGMDERIAVPRLDVPRTKISSGSVGIAGKQTGVYPIESPGGWQLIGRTPLRLFDPLRKQPFLFEAGNYIRFYQISAEQYSHIEAQVKNNNYIVKTINYAGKEVL